MSIAGGIVIFTIIWWVIFFMALPFGVRSPGEAGESLVPGQAESAPVRPMLLRKAAVTTAITCVLTAILWASNHYDWVDWRALFDVTA